MGSTKCLNCGATMSCGCQKRVASDGKSVCTACAATYEQQMKQKKTGNNSVGLVTGVTVEFLKPKN